MDIIGYLASLFVGISLGLIGGGGSILTVPVLVYLFSIAPTTAISYSLFIVGFTSLIGAYRYHRKGLLDFNTVLLFGSSSVTTVFVIRKFITPFLPDVFFKFGSITVTHSSFVMVVFSILMLVASVFMIKDRKEVNGHGLNQKFGRVLVFGVLIGLVTGFLGAGGGFLLIPALVILIKLPVKKAIGTSLLIVAINSIIGFLGDISHHSINWLFLSIATAITITGVFIGSYFNGKVQSNQLRRGFGWFVLTMGILIFVKELFI